jgi:hypothetical protein
LFGLDIFSPSIPLLHAQNSCPPKFLERRSQSRKGCHATSFDQQPRLIRPELVEKLDAGRFTHYS